MQTLWFDQITMNTGGDFYDINGNFRDVLLQISRLNESGRYLLRYNSSANLTQLHTLKIELHYQGKGGADTEVFGLNKNANLVNCFPNPADNAIRIDILNPFHHKCEVRITDLYGREVKSFSPGNDSFLYCEWLCNVADDPGIKPGFYFVKVIMTDEENFTTTETVMVCISN